jgi:glycosyltransferase involved in cell wall biosynthesis
MNVLHTITAYPPSVGGAQLHAYMLAQHLRTGGRVQVVCQWDTNRTDWLLGTTLGAPAKPCDYALDGVRVHRLGLSHLDKARVGPFVPLYYPLMPVALAAISSVLQRHLRPYAAEADLVHNMRVGREGLTHASWRVARLRDVPFVLTPLHHPRWVGWRYREFIKLYRQADAVIALTNAEKQVLVALGVPEERVAVTGHGPVLAPTADPQAFLRTHGIDGPMVLLLGQHYPYKGYRQLLQAAQFVWQKVPEAHFVFIGPPAQQSEGSFAGCDRRVHRLGKVSLQRKTDALAACTVLCVPSTQESFGGVYTEAWSFAKPVIGCNIPPVADVVTHAGDGYLVDQRPPEIAEAVCQILLDAHLARAMGLAGRAKVEQRYTWARIAALTQQAYEQAVQSGRSGCGTR